MTDTVISTSQTYSGRAYSSAAAGDTVTILPDVYAYGQASSTSSGLFDIRHAGRLTNYGTLIGNLNSNLSGTVYIDTPVGASVSLNNHGTITGTGAGPIAAAVFVYEGTATITNSGRITADGFAITHVSGTTVTIINSGLIATSGATAISGDYTGSTVIRNDGQIVGAISTMRYVVNDSIANQAHGTITGAVLMGGGDDGLTNAGVMTGDINMGIGNDSVGNSGSITGAILLGTGTDMLTNTGAIAGSVDAGDGDDRVANHGDISGFVQTGGGVDTLVNDGRIGGSVSLGSGDDSFVNILGSVTGNVDLGAGNDAYDGSHGGVGGSIAGGLGDDRLTGGDSSDTIYGDTATADPGNGDPAGGSDTIMAGYGDDIVYGGYGNDFVYGNQGDDMLYGNQGNDFLHGGQGDDMLFGGRGDDLLNGGRGDDTLAGNLNDDTFLFDARFGHDVVTDFGTVAGNNDYLQFGAGTFADYADVQAHMVQSGANVVITLDAGNSVTLFNVTTAALTPDHFLFG